jgi:putative tricarboxylic transport membrane protein
MDEPSGASIPIGRLRRVSAGLLLNAALITTIGFIFSCTLCYLLAVQGLRRERAGRRQPPRTWLIDIVTGCSSRHRSSGCSLNSWRSICQATGTGWL